MKDYSIPMALVDFIPVFMFAAASVVLQRRFYYKMSKGAFALFAAGTIDVVCAGFAKALYKLLYAANICDFEPLSSLFFPLQSIGFLLAGLGIIAMVYFKQTEEPALLAAPVTFLGTPLFVMCMVLGVALMDLGLGVIAVRGKKAFLVAVFALSFLLELTMGYLSSRDFSQALINWCVQGINILAQGLFLYGALSLRDIEFLKEK